MLIPEQEFPIAFLTAGEREGEAALSLAISFSTLPVYIAFLFNRTGLSDSDFAPAIPPLLLFLHAPGLSRGVGQEGRAGAGALTWHCCIPLAPRAARLFSKVGQAGERTSSRLKLLPLERNRGVSKTQIAWQTKEGVSKRWVFQSLPGQPLASEKNNGYFSALFLYLHLSDGKLRPPSRFAAFTTTSRTKRWFSPALSPRSPTYESRAVALKCENHLQEQKCKMQRQPHSHWGGRFGHWCRSEEAGSALSPAPQRKGNETMSLSEGAAFLSI